MRTLIVLIPEGYFVDYFVYDLEAGAAVSGTGPDDSSSACILKWNGKIRFRGEGTSSGDVRRLVEKYSPEAVAVRILYGGDEFRKTEFYEPSVVDRLASLSAQSPMHIPAAVKLIRSLARIVPTPDILLHFETAFFTRLPARERSYAIDRGLEESYGEGLGNVSRFGYHGIFHGSVSGKIRQKGSEARKIISICLEPVPEVAGIYDGKPVTVSGGATPFEGLPGNTTCGEIDPGIVMLLEDKKKWGPETINDILTRRSGLTALAGEPVNIADVLRGGTEFAKARNLFEYRLLLSCGSAAGVMGGFDAIAFSGRYVGAAEQLAGRLVPRLSAASAERVDPFLFYMHDSLDGLLAEDYCRSRLAAAPV